MSAMGSVVKTLVVPAVIALFVFLLLTYLLVPLWRRYRSRYSQYLPVDTITTRTASLRQRIQSTLGRYLVPSAWRRRMQDRLADSSSDDSSTDGEDDGEELDVVRASWHRQLAADAADERPDHTRRLSRDLEQGFMDDSDDEMPPR